MQHQTPHFSPFLSAQSILTIFHNRHTIHPERSSKTGSVCVTTNCPSWPYQTMLVPSSWAAFPRDLTGVSQAQSSFCAWLIPLSTLSSRFSPVTAFYLLLFSFPSSLLFPSPPSPSSPFFLFSETDLARLPWLALSSCSQAVLLPRPP